MTAYYNEFDPKAAAWLRQLILNGDIAPGVVDERSIINVKPADLAGYTQHHFFAGVGVWSYALRSAGWSDDMPACTASLPCQPFSAAGNQKGKEDERHLLPHFLELVKECGFNTIFGEQVESAIRHGWLDDLYTEMERESYTVGAAVLGAHSVNAPHQRQRIYWVASGGLPNTEDRNRRSESQCTTGISREARDEPGGNGEHCGLANSINKRPEGRLSRRQDSERKNLNGHAGCDSADSGLGNPNSDRCEQRSKTTSPTRHGNSVDSASGIDWLYCRDNKYRPIKSSLKPLVDGVARGVVYRGGAINPNDTGLARTIRLKGYGNAINADVACEFITAYMEVKGLK